MLGSIPRRSRPDDVTEGTGGSIHVLIPRAGRFGVALSAFVALTLTVASQDLAGQVVGDTLGVPASQVVVDPTLLPVPLISPGSAFLRALIIPGWGHSSLESYTRGGFYFFTQASTAWMLVRINKRINSATLQRDLRITEVEALAAADGVTDPAEILQRVDDDPEVEVARSLIEARDQQFEDWLAVAIFGILLGGADAYVSAHLSNFPQPISIEPSLLGAGGVEIGVSIPVGGRGTRRR